MSAMAALYTSGTVRADTSLMLWGNWSLPRMERRQGKNPGACVIYLVKRNPYTHLAQSLLSIATNTVVVVVCSAQDVNKRVKIHSYATGERNELLKMQTA